MAQGLQFVGIIHYLLALTSVMLPTPTTVASNAKEDQASETTSLLLNDNGSNASNDSSKDEGHQKWMLTTASLAFALLVQSYLLVSVFPYSGFLAMHLVPGLTEETNGSYAGLIASSFMMGRTFSSFEWGKAADKYGRVFVIKASLLLSAIFSVLFGLAPTFSLALLSRFVLGLCNGLIGPIKTLISELSHGNQAKETNMMAIVMGMWGYGFLLNPAISGYLSDPVKQYPDSGLVELSGPVLRANPFLLPNLVGCLFCLVGFGLVHLFVEETLPLDKRQVFGIHSVFPCCCWKRPATSTLHSSVSSWGLFKHLHFTPAEVRSDEDALLSTKDNDNGENADGGTALPRWIRPSPSTTALVILSPRSTTDKRQSQQNTVSTKEPAREEKQGEPATIQSLWQRQSTRQHLMVYWVYSFLVISVDETFPLYCISKNSGLAIEEKMIGNILSGTGLCYITIQYFLLTKLVDRFGFYKSLRIGALLSIPLICLIPVSLVTNKSAPEGTLTWSTLLFLSVVYAIARAFSSVTFATLTMTTNRTVPAHQRATMNGLSMLGGSLAKGAGPAFAGLLFSTSVGHVTPPFGSVVVYSTIALLGLCLFVQALLLPEHEPLQDNNNKTLDAVSEDKQGEDDDRPPSF